MGVVQHAEFTGTFPISSGAVAFASNVVAGNTIVVCTTRYQPVPVTFTVTDSLGNTYTAGTNQAQGNYHARTARAENITGGACTVTVTIDAGSDLWFSITEVDNAPAASFDAQATAAGTSTGPTVSLTTVADSTIAFGVSTHDNGTDPALGVGAGYTLIHEQEGGSAVMPGISEYQAFATAGAKTVNTTISTSAGWAIASISIKQNVAGGGPTVRRMNNLRPNIFAPGGEGAF